MADRSGWCRLTKALRSSCSFPPPKALPSNALDDDRRGHTAGGAHRHQPSLEVAPFQFVQHRADQDRAGRPDGVAERDRAAIDVDLLTVELEIPDELFGDDRKRLVDLEQADIVDRETCLGQ